MTGTALAAARRRLGLSQTELGEKINRTQTQISRYETGAKSIPAEIALAVEALEWRGRMKEYRACYWISEDRQAEVRLTGPEHAHLSDDELMEVAKAEAEDTGLEIGDGSLEIGDWAE